MLWASRYDLFLLLGSISVYEKRYSVFTHLPTIGHLFVCFLMEIRYSHPSNKEEEKTEGEVKTVTEIWAKDLNWPFTKTISKFPTSAN